MQLNFDKIPSVDTTQDFDLKIHFGEFLDLQNQVDRFFDSNAEADKTENSLTFKKIHLAANKFTNKKYLWFTLKECLLNKSHNRPVVTAEIIQNQNVLETLKFYVPRKLNKVHVINNRVKFDTLNWYLKLFVSVKEQT